MIKLYLFGGFRAEDQQASPLAFATNKVRALLAYLAATPGQVHARQQVAHLLWPAATEAIALRNLRTTLVRLRATLGDPPWLAATRQEVQLTAEPHQLWIDVAAFEQIWAHLQTGNGADQHPLKRGQPQPEDLHAFTGAAWAHNRLTWMAEAATLYQGEFLAGFFWQEENEGAFWQWRRQKQEEYHAKALTLLDQLAAHAITSRAYSAATAYARRQLALEPWREPAHRQLMLALAGNGDYSGALAHYAICQQTVWAELGMAPEAETTALVQRLQAERQQLSTPNEFSKTTPVMNRSLCG